MRGLLDNYRMAVQLMYDPSDDTVVVAPGNSDTVFPANPSCRLRSWTRIGDVDSAARAAVKDFHSDLAVGVTIAVTAYALSTEEAQGRVSGCARDVVASHVAGAAAEAVLGDPLQQAAVASVLVRAHNGSVTAGGVARDVAIDAFKKELRRKDPRLADAFSVGSFVACTFR